MTESEFRRRVVKLLRPLCAFAVENVVYDGCPDVCLVTGWLELKIAKLPKRPTTPVVVGLRDSQRAWLRRWRRHGGNAWTLCRVEVDVGARWVLHDGEWGASYHDSSVWTEWIIAALGVWNDKPDQQDICRMLTRSLPHVVRSDHRDN